MKFTKIVVVIIALIPLNIFAQNINVKTNLISDINSNLNLSTEFRVGKQATIDLLVDYNPFTFSDNRKIKHILLQPSYRRWLCNNFEGHFFGAHMHYAYYNAGGMLPFGFKDGKMFGKENRNISNSRYEGWLLGAGVSYGYQWIISRKISLEAEVGFGYAYMDYDKYPCYRCGEKLRGETRHYIGPTKLGLRLIYFIK